MCILHRLDIHEIQSQYAIDVALVKRIVLDIFTQMVNIYIFKVFFLGNRQYFSTIGCGEEFTLSVQQFQRIPMTWIMTCRDDNTSSSLRHSYGKFCCWRCSQTDIYHIVANTHQGTANDILYHLTRNTCIATNDNLIAVRLTATANECCVCGSKLHDIQRIQRITCTASDGSSNTRYRFY